jgi:hypothetical protein
MRHLLQTDVLKRAASAALITALLCYPRFAWWLHRPQPVWILVSIVFLASTVLWGGVFAWHSRYCHRPVFAPQWESITWGWTTLTALPVAAVSYLWLDPWLRECTPADYPTNLEQWLAMTFFHLAFVQLFLIFAPFAWSIRLFQDRKIATVLTVAFGVGVLLLKVHSSLVPVPVSLLAVLVLLRIVFGLLLVAFYLRGGLALAWWWGFLIEARHLLYLVGRDI